MHLAARLLPLLAITFAGIATSAPLVFSNFARIDYPSSVGSTFATGINDSGLVTGSGLADDGHAVGFVYSPTTATFTTIDLGAGSTFPGKINGAGTVVGVYQNQTQTQGFGFIDQAGVITYDAAHAILSIDDIGDSSGYVLGSGLAYVDRQGQTTTFGCGQPYNFARDINNAGVAVGVSEFNGQNASAFVYRNGQCIDISVPGASFSQADGINDRGDIVGDYDTGDDAGVFLLRSGVYYLAPTYPDNPPDDFNATVIYELDDINNEGMVAGDGYDFATGEYFAFTATIPSPSTDALIALGGITLLIGRRRRPHRSRTRDGCPTFRRVAHSI